ncbi:MAG: peptidase [Thaumarchaeota archaeon]|nr:MAG: peptidase [Nitrososphaerota archaeon]
MYKILAIFLVILLILPQTSPLGNAKAYSDHPNLFVSAENSLFENHFSGAMVVEVIVREDNTQLDQTLGEPPVTVNGRQLRMVQSSDGSWYAFFANTDKAKQADQVVPPNASGESLDFGVFCSGSTSSSVLGADFSQTDGVAIPDSANLTGTTDGDANFNSCDGTPAAPSNKDNVVRFPPSLNMNPKVPVGQIGINPNVWPLIQLFTFSNAVHIEYNRGGGTQSVDLDYFEIPNITIKLDREAYPQGSEVFATINDIQLNEDPTSVDSWTFNVDSPQATFYQAFAESGKSASGPGLVNLIPYLDNLGFKDNGHVEMNLGGVVNLKTNFIQTTTSLTAGSATYDKLLTFVETGQNTGIFESSLNSISTIGILPNAPRSQSGTIEYNLERASIVSGTTTASLAIGSGQGQFNSGQKETITLVDNDQNLNAGLVDELNIFRSSAVIPTLKIGNPVTLESSSDVKFYPNSVGFAGAVLVPSNIPDSNSARLLIDTRSVSTTTNFEKITLNLGVTAQNLKDLFIDTTQPNSDGTNWINYDLRSFQQQLGIASFSDASMTLYFGGLPGSSSVQIVSSGTIAGGNGLVQIDNVTITRIESISSGSPVFLEINFDTSGDPSKAGKISSENDTQPIVFDLFSFGSKNGQQVNNAIYRAELRETSSSSGIFSGTIEYSIINQLNQFDPNLIHSLKTFGNQIKFLVNDQLINEKGINFSISSSEGGQKTTVTSKNNLPTHAGTVTLDSTNYRIGQPVTITLYDPDLVTDADTIQTYTSVSDPSSLADDTVGDSSGNILLEVWIKGFKFHHCTINGIAYGGLAATGFALTETSPGIGVFKGTFKMPSRICNEDGTSLISPTGGNIQLWYHDFKDAFGRSVIIGSTVATPAKTYESSTPVLAYSHKISQSIQITDDNGRPLLQNPKLGQTINFKSLLSNNDIKESQRISYIVQIKDSDNKVVLINWLNNNLSPSTSANEEIKWKPTSPGIYSIEIFVWDGMDSLVPLIEKKEYKLQVFS